MASICYKKPHSCNSCEYYKHDQDYMGMVCTKDIAIKSKPYLIAVGEDRTLLDITDAADTYEEAMGKLDSQYHHIKYGAIWTLELGGFKEIYIRRNGI